MGAGFPLHVVSERGAPFSDLVDHISVPGVQGSLGIYHGHAPLLSRLKPGVLKITRCDGGIDMMMLEGGLIEVQRTGVTILANSFQRAEELDRERALRARDRAQECLRACSDEARLRQAYAKLEAALARLHILDAVSARS